MSYWSVHFISPVFFILACSTHCFILIQFQWTSQYKHWYGACIGLAPVGLLTFFPLFHLLRHAAGQDDAKDLQNRGKGQCKVECKGQMSFHKIETLVMLMLESWAMTLQEDPEFTPPQKNCEDCKCHRVHLNTQSKMLPKYNFMQKWPKNMKREPFYHFCSSGHEMDIEAISVDTV